MNGRGLSFIAAALLSAPFLAVYSAHAVQPGNREAIVYPVVSPQLSSSYGNRIHPIQRCSRFHEGVDLAAPESSHVRAVASGVVVFAGSYGGYGRLVTIQHREGYVSMYGHLSEISVQVGDHIKAGTLIGRVGSTGRSTGPHLHFEWRKDGVSKDPLKVFPHLASEAEG